MFLFLPENPSKKKIRNSGKTYPTTVSSYHYFDFIVAASYSYVVVWRADAWLEFCDLKLVRGHVGRERRDTDEHRLTGRR